MDLQNPQNRTIFLMLIFGGVLFVIILIVLFLPDRNPPGGITPTPVPSVTPYPTPEILDKTEDGMLIYRKNPDGTYIVESLDPNISDEEIENQLDIADGVEYQVIVPGPAIPYEDLENVEKEEDYDEILREEYGLNPEHSE